MTLATAPHTEAEPAPYKYRWMVLATVLAAEVMDLLDSTIINVAAPSVQRSIGGTFSTIQWIAAGYTLAFAVMLITGGRLGDIFGRKKMFLLGAAGFTLSSIACALCQTPGQLITARVLQGALGAIMIPQGLGVLKAVFPPKEMGAAFGAFGPVMGLSAVCGPIMAGALIDADWFGTGWRMIFLVNVPLGLIAFFAALRYMPEGGSPDRPKLDLLGALLVTAGSLALIYPLVQGQEKDWPAWMFALMAASVPIFALFTWYQSRRRNSPLVEPSLLKQRAFTGGLAVFLVFFAAMVGFMLVFGLFAQIGLGYSPLKAGLNMAPWSFGIAIGAVLAGAVLTAKLGRRVVHLGLIVMGIGQVAIWFTLGHYGTAVTVWNFLPATLLSGIGMGMGMVPLFDFILAGVNEREVGSASGVLNAFQQLGGSIGVALLGTLFFHGLGGRPSGGDFVHVTQNLLWICLGLYALTFALVFLLPKKAREDQTH
ncbi:putative actinorhodin transporter [Longispora fulva]|uniref:EmrB/QacA subfamily drug resistance transporter n=1 Tax=Longispora fulva TaxID=619741 RepID=A0A8J7KSQ4_9ACTN|nr:MFS transporter [Longispora fulva]MBG6139887.1 EmrB/QacA subfamily drug resistance transporter [Longispora fulva]GIG57728.1 putative actinorhodin transporter [Longispora fulva]